MSSLYITHYYVQGTDPWKNIMLLSAEASFRKAVELSSAHKGMASYGRFTDFIKYYPLRKAADKLVREQFICLGGKPQLEHPCSFVPGESDYLKTWFDEGDSLRIPLDGIFSFVGKLMGQESEGCFPDMEYGWQYTENKVC